MDLLKELKRLTSELCEYIFEAVVSANKMRFSVLKRECQDCGNQSVLLELVLQGRRWRWYECI
jgi:hypothetical protein